ncbi:hypothetical protein BKH43_05615 [Helicobacter sp. 13S00401-1]|nr:hypothetical protein BKH43_05615 [Helicobacter sp. 13S00401-1]
MQKFKSSSKLDARLDYTDALKYIRENIILNKGHVYLDYSASALAFGPIEKRIRELLPYLANTHSNSSTHAQLMSLIYDEAKTRLKKILKLEANFALLCNFPNSSSAIKRAQEILGVYIPPKLKEILHPKPLGVCLHGGFEHHSNEISWRESLLKSEGVSLDTNLEFSLENTQAKIDTLKNKGALKGIKLASFNLASNVTGLIAPFKDLSPLLRKEDFIVMYDLAASAPHLLVEGRYFDIASYASHKLLGAASASSLLAFDTRLYDATLPPSFAGGGSIKYANSLTQEYFLDIERREEAGTLDILGLVRTALAFQLVDEVGFSYIELKEQALRQVLLYELKNIPAISIYGESYKSATACISFNVAGISPYSLSYMLSSEYNIQTRAGCSCAGPYGHELLGLKAKSFKDLDEKPGWLRVSPHFCESLENIYYFLDSLTKSVRILRNKMA